MVRWQNVPNIQNYSDTVVKSQADCKEWWQMKFHVDKCKVMHTGKTICIKRWGHRCAVAVKANRMLEWNRREENLMPLKSMVCPHLEY